MYKPILYNEKEQGEQVYKNGFSESLFNRRELISLAKYYRHILNYGDRRIRTNLILFCQKHDVGFNEVLHAPLLKESVSSSKRPFVVKKKILFSEKEMKVVREVEDFQGQKFLLGLLAFAKRDKGYVSVRRWTDIKKCMGLASDTKRLYEFINLFYKKGYVEPSRVKRYGSAHKVLFVDDSEEGKSVLKILTDSDFRRLGDIYVNYCGDIVHFCKTCGAEMEKRSNRHVYCDSCREERHRTIKRKWWRKKREKGLKIH